MNIVEYNKQFIEWNVQYYLSTTVGTILPIIFSGLAYVTIAISKHEKTLWLLINIIYRLYICVVDCGKM